MMETDLCNACGIFHATASPCPKPFEVKICPDIFCQDIRCQDTSESELNSCVFPYCASRDYKELALRMAVMRIVCFVDYGTASRDVATTRFGAASEFARYQIGARGICYIEAGTLEEFSEQCGKLNVQWLYPTAFIC